MKLQIRSYNPADLPALTAIWNAVVEEGMAFPQETPLFCDDAAVFFAQQSYTGVAVADDTVTGLYILHPNNVGRCGHLANASYAVCAAARGHKIGEALVRDSLQQARALGFGVLQFNAVVHTNARAIRLYESLGFTRLGTVPKGFRMKDGSFEDIVLFYYSL